MTKIYKNQGLTLIEIIIVVAIFGLIVSFGMMVDLNFLRGDAFRNEQYTIVSLLEKARSRAMANFFESTHGVCYDEDKDSYVIFQNSCDSGAPTSELVPANVNIAENPNTNFPTFIFSQLSGNTNGDTIHIEDGIKSADIIINDEGTINW